MNIVAPHATALLVAVVCALVYLAVVQLADMNEREPLWSMVLLFVLGFLAAGVLNLLVSSVVLELRFLQGALLKQLATLAALAVGFGILSAAARLRGWSELNGIMDGIVYGAATGFGFATGEAFVRELRISELAIRPAAGLLPLIWTTALSGLASGVFGAIAGSGLAAAVLARGNARRVATLTLGFAGAVVAHTGYELLAYGNSLGGAAAAIRSWIALLVPIVCVLGVAVYSWRQERHAIRTELEAELNDGTLDRQDLNLLSRAVKRHGMYLRTAASGQFRTCARLMARHNRQVQLALVKRRAGTETDETRRRLLSAELDALRTRIASYRSE